MKHEADIERRDVPMKLAPGHHRFQPHTVSRRAGKSSLFVGANHIGESRERDICIESLRDIVLRV